MTEQEVRKYLRKMKEESSEKAFHSFFNLFHDRLFRIAFFYLRKEEWTQEVVIDVFMKIWEKRESLLEIQNIEDYCFVLTKNAAFNFLEKEHRHDHEELLSSVEKEESDVSPEDTVISEELFARYVKALDRLPEKCREIFLLVKEEHLSYAETAQRLGVSIKTVDTQLQRAKERLRKMLLDES